MDFLLSPHFSMREMIATNHRTINNYPNDMQVIENLRVLCHEFLEPLRAEFKCPIHVNSGYRCPELNEAIGGTKDSAHLYGCAADIEPVSDVVSLDAMMVWFTRSALEYDQIIREHASTSDWLHIGMLRPGHEPAPRKQALIYVNGVYSPWNH